MHALALEVQALDRPARSTLKVGDIDLAALGTQRAQAIKCAVPMGTVLDAERVFKLRVGTVQSESGCLRVVLSLQYLGGAARRPCVAAWRRVASRQGAR